MTSLLDILTTAKNLVVAINQLGQTYVQVQGAIHSSNIPASTTSLIVSGQGRLASLYVTAASGGTVGLVYDSNSASSLTNPICAIPATAGAYVINSPYTTGLVVVTQAGMSVTLCYS